MSVAPSGDAARAASTRSLGFVGSLAVSHHAGGRQMTILDLQKALKRAGFDPGPLDGISGPKTRAAIKAFQAARGLVVDGIAGPVTRGRLMAPEGTAAVIPASMPWLVRAHGLLGLKEAPGKADNPAILGWAKAAGLPYDHDEIPWCGLFVAHCLDAALPMAELPANPLGARQWLGFGTDVAPQLGAVLVFWRGSRDGWTGHVGFYWGEDDSAFHVLASNFRSERVAGAAGPDFVAALL